MGGSPEDCIESREDQKSTKEHLECLGPPSHRSQSCERVLKVWTDIGKLSSEKSCLEARLLDLAVFKSTMSH